MKSTIRFLLVLGLLAVLALLLGVVVSAQGPSTYGSTFQLQNLESSEADITIRFYESDGSVAKTLTDTIEADGSNTYFAVTIPDLPTTFEGSAVVESNQPIRAIANLYGDNFAFGGAASAGYTSGAEELSLPLIMRNNSGYETWFSVQNAGSAIASVVVTYTAGSAGSDWTHSAVNIPPGASYTFDQSDSGHSSLGTTFIGSATVVGSQPIVATVVEVGPSSLFAYDGFTSSDTEFIAPLFHYNNAGFSSSINVQNAGDVSTTVTIEYTPSAKPGGGTYGTACEETQSIDPGSGANFGFLAFYSGGGDCYDQNPGTQFIGSANVKTNSASQPLVAVVNQHNFSTGKAAAYNGFGPDEGAQCVSLPLVMDRNSGYWTSINVVNVGSSSTTVTIDYSDFGTAADDTFTLGAGVSQSLLHYPGGNPVEDGYVGSATVCGANSTDEILVVVNEQNLVASGDALYTYNGFPLD